ncbi:hypothetical protein SNE40_001290 [Patella caerulea]|uniref:SCD domain-containing protein n=1 Tax=Patella caerulea TaxID=87958 RepID=A0AAN8KDQ2_PATCE
MPAARGRKGKEAAAAKKAREQEEALLDTSSEHLEPASEGFMPEAESDTEFEEPKAKGKKGGKKDGSKRMKKDMTKKKVVEEEFEGDGSLFDIVRLGRASLQAVVDDWIETYKANRDTALLELIQFFIQCSGCKGKITPYMYTNMEHAEIIRKMTEEFDEESGDYPFISSGPQWKKFKTNFCEFVQVLVRQCQYSIIYDQYMMDNIISLLTGLTDSQVRAFRHTSTMAAMKLMTALVDVALNLSINLDNTQRQYESERAKQQNKRASERLELLMTKRQELEENQAEIRNMLTYIFKGVFVHRYRDTQPEIRKICMGEIGVWMKKYPNMFLDDSYLKYVGWTMYDKGGDVRLCCLKTLSPLYYSNDLSPKLELFTNRFKDRIVEMTLDKEYEVAVAAVKLACSILKFSDNVLADKDCENVYELVYSSHRQVAQAAGDFLNTKLFSRDEEENRHLKSLKGKKLSPNTPLIRDLVQFFIESELHEHGAYLVDSLWEINEMMKDWECMTDLLLEDPSKGEEPLDDRQETSLIEIMVCCVKQAATGESPVGRGPANKRLTAKEQKQVSEDKTKLTEHFIVTLPQLLLKYLMDAEKVANLLQIPQYFELEIYTSSRQEKHLDSLLRYLHEIVEKHTDTEVLEAATKCFEALCNEEYAIAGKCDVARKTLIDSLVVKYRDAMQDFFTEGDEPDDDEAFALLASLKRIHTFYCCHDLGNWDLWEDLFHVIRCANENSAIPEEIITKAVSACSMALLWYLQKIDEKNPDKDRLRYIKKRLNNLMRHCNNLLLHQLDKVVEEAYITICDLLVVFSRNLAEFHPDMKQLVFEPDKNLQNELSNFLSEKVFVEDDDEDVDENVKIEELHKRRNFLACFCKLVVYNIISIRTGANMFKHYMKFYNDYGDIIKATLSKSREINKVLTAKTLALSLTQLYKELQNEQGTIERSSDVFQSIKELSRRFALSFGLDQVKNREAVAAMHKEGIVFSLQPADGDPEGHVPPNLPFLEVLCEFTNKLMKQDKKVVLGYLDNHIPGGFAAARGDEWQPYFTYRNSLTQGDGEINPITLKQATQKRFGKRKADTFNDESLESSYDAMPTPAATVGLPMHQSTAVKRQRMMEMEDQMMSDHGSEQDFDDHRMSQASWLNSQHGRAQMQRQQEAGYGRRQIPNVPHQESSSEQGSIGEFESPQSVGQPPQPPRHGYYQQPPHPQQHHSQQMGQQQQQGRFYQGFFEDDSQYIDDASAHQHPAAPAYSEASSNPSY